jgi:hypothetical protein
MAKQGPTSQTVKVATAGTSSSLAACRNGLSVQLNCNCPVTLDMKHTAKARTEKSWKQKNTAIKSVNTHGVTALRPLHCVAGTCSPCPWVTQPKEQNVTALIDMATGIGSNCYRFR